MLHLSFVLHKDRSRLRGSRESMAGVSVVLDVAMPKKEKYYTTRGCWIEESQQETHLARRIVVGKGYVPKRVVQ